MAISLSFLDGLLDTAQKFLDAAGDEEFVWNGETYPAIVSGQSSEVEIDENGNVRRADISIVVRTAEFDAGQPAEDDRITVAGAPFRVGTVKKPRDGLSLRMLCYHDESGA